MRNTRVVSASATIVVLAAACWLHGGAAGVAGSRPTSKPAATSKPFVLDLATMRAISEDQGKLLGAFVRANAPIKTFVIFDAAARVNGVTTHLDRVSFDFDRGRLARIEVRQQAGKRHRASKARVYGALTALPVVELKKKPTKGKAYLIGRSGKLATVAIASKPTADAWRFEIVQVSTNAIKPGSIAAGAGASGGPVKKTFAGIPLPLGRSVADALPSMLAVRAELFFDVELGPLPIRYGEGAEEQAEVQRAIVRFAKGKLTQSMAEATVLPSKAGPLLALYEAAKKSAKLDQSKSLGTFGDTFRGTLLNDPKVVVAGEWRKWARKPKLVMTIGYVLRPPAANGR